MNRKHSKTMYYHVLEEPWTYSLKKKFYKMTFSGYATEDEIVIGIAVCSKTDIFLKSEGRDRSEERLEHNPTYKFPRMHKNSNTAVYYWLEVLEDMALRNGKVMKDHVARLQKEFDKTQWGIQLKMARQKKEAEAEEERQRKYAIYLKEKKERAKQYKK